MFMDFRKFKFMCLQAYCLEELLIAEKSAYQEECLAEEDRSYCDEVLKTICDRIKEAGNTFENVKQLAKRFTPLAMYHNTINKTVEKHFKEGDKYIPAFLSLSILQEYTLRGHKMFADIDFNNVLVKYEHENNYVKKHYKCALDVVETLEKTEAVKKVRKQNKRKR